MTEETQAIEDIVEMRSGISRVFEEMTESRKTVAGIHVSPEASLSCSAVLACVRVISESLAALPIGVYERLPDGGKRLADSHPLHEILAYQPNDWMTSYEWRELMQSWLLLWGNAYSLIKPSGTRGSVGELIPLHPSRMTIERIKNGRLRYLYMEPGQATPTTYRQDQIFHLRWLSSDGVTGYVPTTLSRDAIALARATELHSGAFFGNGARAGTVIETDQPMKPETLQRLREQWNDLHGGSANAYRTAVMPHGAHVKELTVNNDTNRLIETRRYQCEEVARGYRVPSYMIGDLTKSSYSSVEQQAIDFVTFTLIPHLRRFESACRRDLVTDDRRYFVQFDVSDLMVGDFQARAAFLREMFNLAVFDVDELRQQLGFNPLPDGQGKKRFIQVNMQLLDNFTVMNPTGQGQPETVPSSTQQAAPPADQTAPEAVQPEAMPAEAQRAAAELLFTHTLRKLAAIEADGILERRNKPAKLAAWFEAHEQRMRTELLDAAKATGRDIDEFTTTWVNRSRDLLLDCHRSGKPYEEVTATWTDRANLNGE
jgi:HK97 family phage portal protein